MKSHFCMRFTSYFQQVIHVIENVKKIFIVCSCIYMQCMVYLHKCHGYYDVNKRNGPSCAMTLLQALLLVYVVQANVRYFENVVLCV